MDLNKKYLNNFANYFSKYYQVEFFENDPKDLEKDVVVIVFSENEEKLIQLLVTISSLEVDIESDNCLIEIFSLITSEVNSNCKNEIYKAIEYLNLRCYSPLFAYNEKNNAIICKAILPLSKQNKENLDYVELEILCTLIISQIKTFITFIDEVSLKKITFDDAVKNLNKANVI